MTLEQLANIGELIGGLAVVASLIYLAIQIRQNTKIVKGATLSSNIQNWTNVISSVTHPEMAAAHLVGSMGRAAISSEQFTQFFYHCRIFFVAFEDQYYQFRHGTLDEAIYRGYERSIQAQALVSPGYLMYWEISRQEFSPEFANRIDALIKDNPNKDPSYLLSKWRELSAGNYPDSSSDN
ncbi:MAG: hypothetical protein OXU66_01075 [Gammaproteobacteria bacterium]|nr:hypothetical protein [Gammaproteobacteria bacterium]MDD9957508.1 hypothetical protein [Gammaproteobacteria bacterium]